MREVTEYGQVNKGDLLFMSTCYGSFKVRAKEILYKGTEEEEILIHKRANHYFILSMLFEGKSWVNRAWVVPDGYFSKNNPNYLMYKPYIKGNVKNL